MMDLFVMASQGREIVGSRAESTHCVGSARASAPLFIEDKFSNSRSQRRSVQVGFDFIHVDSLSSVQIRS